MYAHSRIVGIIKQSKVLFFSFSIFFLLKWYILFVSCFLFHSLHLSTQSILSSIVTILCLCLFVLIYIFEFPMTIKRSKLNLILRLHSFANLKKLSSKRNRIFAPGAWKKNKNKHYEDLRMIRVWIMTSQGIIINYILLKRWFYMSASGRRVCLHFQ
jgi:glucan phosphoethanolaminetransferase (alkaline phosphatase superfamily)